MRLKGSMPQMKALILAGGKGKQSSYYGQKTF